MNLTVYGEVFECANILRTNNSVKAFDVNGICICNFQGVSDFTGYLVDGVLIIEAIPVTEEITLENKVTTLEEENVQLKQQLGLLPPVSNPTTLQDHQTNKIYELYKACEAEILAGFYSSARGTNEWYTNSRDDQSYVLGQSFLASANPAYRCYWKTASEVICTPFTAAQIIQLANDGAAFMLDRRLAWDNKKLAALQATAIEEVEEVTWVNKVW